MFIHMIPRRLCLNVNKTYKNSVRNISSVKDYDLVVIGGGIVGTASAREILLRHPKLKVAVVEKENKLAYHQSGRNSGVIHAGIYYKPGSLRAKLCVEGMQLTYKYCDQKKIPYKKVGKLIVATNKDEEQRLLDLYDRGLKNMVPGLQLIDGDKIKDIEPFCEGVRAIHSPNTGIVDWALVTQYYGRDFTQAGGDMVLNFEVKEFVRKDNSVSIIDKHGFSIKTKYVVTCCGLQADKIAEMSGSTTSPKIVPFRGEYLLLNQEKCHMVKGNIYPVPDPRFPFLGVHFTPRMDGSVWLGPNAVLAFKREGYAWSDFNILELFDALKYPGFIKLASKYMLAGIKEISRSLLIPLQIKELQKYIPDISEYDVSRGPSGVRAQALGYDGQLIEDFVFECGKEGEFGGRILHCCNAPSPGATSSLAISKIIADKIELEFKI